MTDHFQQIPQDFKCGYVALIGQPNVGKSTLMNNLLQFKLSIVTPKPQTTRHRVLGILNEPGMQIIFLDTPGILKPRYRLQEVMVKTARAAVADADLVLFMIDATAGTSTANVEMFREVLASPKPVIIVLNKTDLIARLNLLPIIEYYHTECKISDIIPISAMTGDGLLDLKEAIKKYLPLNVPFYSLDYITEQPERFFVAEIVREKIFQNYGEEIPYSTTVTIEEFKEREKGKDYIRAMIYVERLSQKGILIGKKGAALKTIGQLARVEIEHFLQRAVYLELHVGVKEKWRSKDRALRELGYI